MRSIGETLEFLQFIEKYGYAARVVGGAVRNFLSHETFSDVDIATTALPFQMHEIAQQNDLRFVPLGELYGSCRVCFRAQYYEITALREENGYTNIRFTDSFEIDSRRRDFSINAIYMDKNGRIFDYHNGISDLKNHHVRFIGDPLIRIAEDPIRLLRYIRFAALYGDYDLDFAIFQPQNIDKLESADKNKITREMIRILTVKDIDILLPILRPIFAKLYGVTPEEIPQKSTGKEALYHIIASSPNAMLTAELYGLSPSKVKKIKEGKM